MALHQGLVPYHLAFWIERRSSGVIAVADRRESQITGLGPQEGIGPDTVGNLQLIDGVCRVTFFITMPFYAAREIGEIS